MTLGSAPYTLLCSLTYIMFCCGQADHFCWLLSPKPGLFWLSMQGALCVLEHGLAGNIFIPLGLESTRTVLLKLQCA